MNTNTKISITEFAGLVASVGTDVTVIAQGEPGIGKSAMLHYLADKFPEHRAVYLDAALLDLGDLQMPTMAADRVKFVPNGLFVGDGKPLLLMLDELGKAMRPVQNALLPLLLEHRVGTYYLPEGSVVFGATNLGSDGVGDTMQAHARNRVCFVTVAKPDADAWVDWAMDNDVDPAVAAWVKAYPHCLESYTDGHDDNPYIFNPKKQQTAYVTPRSLFKASLITKKRADMSPQVLIAALSGTIGEAAARDMQAYLSVADALPDRRMIVADPEKCPVPENPTAQTILVLAAAANLKREEANAWMTYLVRLMPEVQALFARQAVRGANRSVVLTNKLFSEWAVKMNYLF